MLSEHGATVLQDPVVVDGNVTTSKGLGTAVELGLQLVRHFLGEGRRGHQAEDRLPGLRVAAQGAAGGTARPSRQDSTW